MLTTDERRHFRTPSHPAVYLERAGYLGLIPRELAERRIRRWKRVHAGH